ncbi:MAG: radical SAM protein [Alphaproteobacteria bacterium]|nr:radical SAM protein [Alphaproteobacteria bacterium]MBF0332059.1 radical SAM protein [Alphaproteobacteria bacterium]
MSEKVDVLFINPGDRKQIYQTLADEFSGIEPPVFAGLFATYLRRKGRSAAIIDAPALGLSAAKVAEMATGEFSAKLVVIVVYGFQPSASTQNMGAAGRIAVAIKELAPHLPVMMTGTHPAALPDRTMRDEAIDFVCDLEGPVTILKTLEAIEARGGFANVPSLWWREEGHIIRPRAAEALVTDLDGEMPGIAWDLLPMGNYRAHNWHCFDHIDERTPYAAIHTSLGCPFRCNFCCINAPFGKPSYRMWSPQTVIREIDFLVERYGVKNIKFVDEMFVLNHRHVVELCDLLASRDYKVNIWAYARVDTVKDEFLDKLKNAGINWLCLGIESASEHVRDGARKRYGNDDIIDVCRRIENAGLYIIGNYIFGLPDDSEQRMKETLDLALELNAEFINFYSAMSYPGSQLYQQAIDANTPVPDQWHQYSQHSYDTTPLPNRHCTSDEIVKFRDQAWQTYFESPRYLDMVRGKFGQKVVDHIQRMASVPLPRRWRDQQS